MFLAVFSFPESTPKRIIIDFEEGTLGMRQMYDYDNETMDWQLIKSNSTVNANITVPQKNTTDEQSK